MRSFFHPSATPEPYTLSLHDALPICRGSKEDHQWSARDSQGHTRSCLSLAQQLSSLRVHLCSVRRHPPATPRFRRDRKSTRLNSSHLGISYAVFCLKKKKNTHIYRMT